MKPWRLVALFLVGMLIGGASGAFFYAKHLDKPESVITNQNAIKQKIKGDGLNVQDAKQSKKEERKETREDRKKQRQKKKEDSDG